ncbi:MAG TPA: uroporphyrinogen-III synthase [Terrimesophilobacter sp.]|nr:uroporphyrinogen-III synthase [Terrimesophilobacter sp.]
MTPARTVKPLSGWRVLIPRGGEWGNGVAAAVRRLGATPVVAPMINFASPRNTAALTESLTRLRNGDYDWLVVTSATTVDVLLSQELRVPDRTKIAAVGETTSSALALAGYRVDFVPEKDNSSRGLVKFWPASPRGSRVLVPQSENSDDVLISGLGSLDISAEFVTAYRTVGVPVSGEVAREVRTGRINGVLITSGSVARQIQVQLAPLPPGTVVAATGPRTAFDARTAGISVNVIAEARTAESLVDAFVDHVTWQARHAG